MLVSYLRLAAGTVLLAGLAACSSGKKDDPAATPPEGISWTVDGGRVTATSVQSQKSSATRLSVAGILRNSTSSGILSLEFPNALGNYDFLPAATVSASAYYTIPGTNADTYYAGAYGIGNVTGAGSIVVTALSATNVTGTFTFTGISASGASKSITNGTFNVGL